MSAVCQCGCGEAAPIAKVTRRGTRAGEPLRFVKGHNWRKSGPLYVIDEQGCWIWQRSQIRGYGQWRDRRGGSCLAHRRMYELMVGPIPEGLQLDHLCRVPLCVNPAHLEPVTNAVNSRRSNGTRLTWDDVHAIRESNESTAVIAARFGIHKVHVRHIKRGKAWVAA